MFRKPHTGLVKASACAALLLSALGSPPVLAQDQYLGQLLFTGFNFAPNGWAMCQGQILPISQNAALFSLLGTNYGGNGTSNFALPDMRGRMPMHYGQGPGLTQRFIGEPGGSETVTLTLANLPQHSHSTGAATEKVSASSLGAGSAVPAAHALANTGRDLSYNALAPDVSLGTNVSLSGNTGISGNQLPFSTQSPYLTVNCLISLTGIFPARQ